MESRRIEFHVALPAAEALGLAEQSLRSAGWRITGREDSVLFGARGGYYAYGMGVELKITPTGEANSTIRCTIWTRVSSFWSRRQLGGQLRRLHGLFAAQTQIEPAPSLQALPPLGGSRPWWAFWRS